MTAQVHIEGTLWWADERTSDFCLETEGGTWIDALTNYLLSMHAEGLMVGAREIRVAVVATEHSLLGLGVPAVATNTQSNSDLTEEITE